MNRKLEITSCGTCLISIIAANLLLGGITIQYVLHEAIGKAPSFLICTIA